MGEIVLSPGDQQKVVSQPGRDEAYNINVNGADVYLSHRSNGILREGKHVDAGDRTEASNLRGKPLYAKNPPANDSDATIEVDQAGFSLTFMNRSVIGAVQTSSGNEAAPANDNEDFASGDGVDLDSAGTQTLVFNGVDAAERLTGLVEFSDDGHVEVHYLNADGTRLTSRTPSENTDYEVTGGGDVYVTPAVASPYVEVDIVDDTAGGTSNVTSWTVYYR